MTISTNAHNTCDRPDAIEDGQIQFKIRRQTTGAFLVFHLIALLAFVPWFFSWAGLIAVFVGNFITGMLGVCLCYHRVLTHRSLKMPNWLEYTCAIFGICSLQDSPAHWVAIHRAHHKHSDREYDPHSPQKSFFWGHIGWLFVKRNEPSHCRKGLIEAYAKDLMKNPFYRFVENGNMWIWIFVAHMGVIFAASFAIGWWSTGELLAATQFGASMLVWGVAVRLVYTWHLTWAVNSVTHVWGYRNYATKDNSRNNALVAMLTWGEGWHNNHHADQRSAAHGHRWWELDLTFLTVRILRLFGLAWDVVETRSSEGKQKSTTSKTVQCNTEENMVLLAERD